MDSKLKRHLFVCCFSLLLAFMPFIGLAGSTIEVDVASFILANEGNDRIIDRLVAAGCTNLYQALIYLRNDLAKNPNAPSRLTGQMDALIASIESHHGSDVFTALLHEFTDSSCNPVGINADGTLKILDIKGRDYYGKTGYATYPEQLGGVGRELFTYATSSEYYIDAGDKPGGGGNLAAIIEAFANSDESRNHYGEIDGGNIASVIDAIYQALFNRAADTAGRDWYVAEFNKGAFTAATIMLNVLYGAQNDDLVTLNNKLVTANLFTQTIDPELDSTNFRATYAGDADAVAARYFLSLVTSAASTVPGQGQITEYIKSYIADPGDAILTQ